MISNEEPKIIMENNSGNNSSMFNLKVVSSENENKPGILRRGSAS